jgi:hypothetical protein
MSEPRTVSFVLGSPTKTLNEIRGMHHRVYAKHRAAIASEVWALTSGQRPLQPFAKARIVVERHSIRDVDIDNIHGGLKPLLDILQPFHAAVRPNGLGIIKDDSPSCLCLEVVPVRSTMAGRKTVVLIQEVS